MRVNTHNLGRDSHFNNKIPKQSCFCGLYKNTQSLEHRLVSFPEVGKMLCRYHFIQLKVSPLLALIPANFVVWYLDPTFWFLLCPLSSIKWSPISLTTEYPILLDLEYMPSSCPCLETTRPAAHILTCMPLPPIFRMAFMAAHPFRPMRLHVTTLAPLKHFPCILSNPQHSAFVRKVILFFRYHINLIAELYLNVEVIPQNSVFYVKHIHSLSTFICEQFPWYIILCRPLELLCSTLNSWDLSVNTGFLPEKNYIQKGTWISLPVH